MKQGSWQEERLMLSDEDLMLSVGRGDQNAFEQVVLRHQASAWDAAYRFLGDPAEAEDITQDAFLKILDAAPRYRPTAKFRTYLFRVLTRLCLDRTRKMGPVYTDAFPDIPDGSQSPLEAVTVQERDTDIRNAIMSLPPNQRMAVILRYYQGLSYAEIASAMETSVKAVERMLARARTSLENSLSHFFKE